MKKYELWQGRKVRGIYGDVFIETNESQWNERLEIWKKLNHYDPNCPCPMPAGHIMFEQS